MGQPPHLDRELGPRLFVYMFVYAFTSFVYCNRYFSITASANFDAIHFSDRSLPRGLS